MKQKSNEQILDDITRLKLEPGKKSRTKGKIVGKERRRTNHVPAAVHSGKKNLIQKLDIADQDDVFKRRLEDSLERPQPSLKRKIISYSFWDGFKIFGFGEYLSSFAAYFNKDFNVYISRRFSELMLSDTSSKNRDFYYSLTHTLAELSSIASMFLGRKYKGLEERVIIALEDEGGYGLTEYLAKFADLENEVVVSLQYLKQLYEENSRIDIKNLAWAVRGLFRLSYITGGIDDQKSAELLKAAAEANIKVVKDEYAAIPGTRNNLVKEINISRQIFEKCLNQLKRYRYELYPALLLMTGCFYRINENTRLKTERFFRFLDLTVKDILNLDSYAAEKLKERERRFNEERLMKIETLELGLGQELKTRHSTALDVLTTMLPGSELKKLDSEYLLPYFYDFFKNDMPFPLEIRNVSMEDPYAVIAVMHKIGYSLLNAIDGENLEKITEQPALRNSLNELKRQWLEVSLHLLEPYLEEISFIVKRCEKEEDKKIFERIHRNTTERRMNEMRKHMMRHFNPKSDRLVKELKVQGRDVKSGFKGPVLYTAVEDAESFAEELARDINSGVLSGSSIVNKKLAEDLKRFLLVDFEKYQNPNDASYSSFMRQMKKYIEGKFNKAVAELKLESQLVFAEIFRDFFKLYSFLVNGEGSFLSRLPDGIRLADEREVFLWAAEEERERNYRIHMLEDQGRYLDGLTGLINRKQLDTVSAEDFEKAKKAKVPLCFAMADIDYFKSFNDTYGHQAGDKVIRAVASCIAASLRKGDYAGRYGGEEFLLVIHNDYADALIEAEKIRKEVEKLQLDIGGTESGKQQFVSLAVSIGLAQTNSFNSYDEALGHADRALYAAKQTGRNRVMYYSRQDFPDKDFDYSSFEEYAARIKTLAGPAKV